MYALDLLLPPASFLTPSFCVRREAPVKSHLADLQGLFISYSLPSAL